MLEETKNTEEVVEQDNHTNEEVEAAATEEKAGAQSEKPERMEKKYTDEDVDRIVSRKIARERERMSKLFNEEQQVSEIEQREQKVLMREMKADAKDALTDRGFPIQLADFLNYEGKEEMEKSLEVICDTFSEIVEREVKRMLKGSTPIRGNGYKPGNDALRNAFRP